MLGSRGDAILFDLDGVLVDSQVPITGCINHALEAHGFGARPPTELVRFIGPPLAAAFAELTGEPLESAVVSACLSSYRARYADVSLQETTVVRGIPAVLAGLAERHRLAVATSKPLVYAEPILDAVALRQFFEVCVGPTVSASGEDKSITIASALASLGDIPAVMVGDRDLDIIGAHQCSLPAIGVTWGIGTEDELRSAQPDVLVDAPDQLPGAVLTARGLGQVPT
jgi:phosphoglycolate phosphatase